MSPYVRTVILVITLLSITRGDAEDRAKPSQLEGRWKVVSAAWNGGNYQHDFIGKMQVTIEKDEIRFGIEGTDAVQAAKFVLHPNQQPAQIDFVKETKDHAWGRDNPVAKLFRGYKLTEGKAIPADDKGEGIYKLEGDKLTLCWRTNAAREIGADGKISAGTVLRPTIFQSHLYYQQFLFVLERVP